MTGDEAIEHVIAEICKRRADWTRVEVRALAEICRDEIARDPDAFVAAFDENIARLEAQR